MKARVFTEGEAATLLCPIKMERGHNNNECGFRDGLRCTLFNFVESAVIDAETMWINDEQGPTGSNIRANVDLKKPE